MQCPVELAIAGPRESVAAMFAAGGLDRRRPAVTGVVMAGGETADISGVPQNLGRQHRPDAMHAGQGGATGGHGGLDLGGIGGQCPIEPTQIRHKILRQGLAVLIGWGHRAHRAQQASGLGSGQIPFRPTGNQIAQQRMEPVDDASALLGQIIPPIRQQPQPHTVILGADHAKPRMMQSNRGHRGGIQRISLTSVTRIEQPGPGGQLGWHVHHLLARTCQSLGHATAQTFGSLHRPATLWPTGRPLLQLTHRRRSHRDPDRGHRLAVGVHRHRSQ